MTPCIRESKKTHKNGKAKKKKRENDKLTTTLWRIKFKRLCEMSRKLLSTKSV